MASGRARVTLGCSCRVIYLQVSMNEGLSYITSSVHITTTECVSTPIRDPLFPASAAPGSLSRPPALSPSSLRSPLLCLSLRGGCEYFSL